MHQRFIVFSVVGFGGNWGAGATLDEAKRKLKKNGGGKVAKAFRFTSELPFAPPDREATDQEADCWMDRYGSMNWIRCNREEVTR